MPRLHVLSLLVAFAAMLGVPVAASATTLSGTFPFDNSEAEFTANVSGLGIDGITNWTVNGQNHAALAGAWFYRAGDTGGEAPVGSLPSTETVAGNVLTRVYTESRFTITVRYTLTPGFMGSDIASLQTQAVVTATDNLASPLNFSLFEYNDFNLADSAGNESVAFDPTTRAFVQTDATRKLTTQLTAGSLFQNIGSFGGDAAEVSDVLNLLGDGNPTTLPAVVDSAMGDVEFAYGFGFVLAPLNAPPTQQGASEYIATIARQVEPFTPPAGAVVPEPMTAALSGLGIGLTLLVLRRRRDDSDR